MTKPSTPEYGRWLAQARAQTPFTQASLAHELGVTVTTVARWEIGQRTPNAEMQERVLAVLSQHGYQPEPCTAGA